MGPKDGWPVANRLQSMLQGLYGFCHLNVTSKGYYLQTSHRGKIHYEILPFSCGEEAVANILARFSRFYDVPASDLQKEVTPPPDETEGTDGKPRRRRNRRPANT